MTTSSTSRRRLRATARFLWHLIPQRPRYWLYHSFMASNNRMIRILFAVFLVHHRANVRKVWPQVYGFDHLALAIWGALLSYHTPALDFAWRRAPRTRLRRGVRAEDNEGRKVLHVTGSFDLGGTQTQIKALCTYPASAYDHHAVEVFPEYNYLFRRGVTVDESRYTGPGLIGRTAGRLVGHPSYRSSQLIQAYKLACDFQHERPRVVVGWGHEMCVTTFVAAAIARVPHIVFCIRTVNPAYYTWLPGPFRHMLHQAHRRMLPMVSAVAVNSTLLRDDHAEWVGMPSADITVCANGIEIPPVPPDELVRTRARVRAEFGIPDGTTVITNVGRFSSEKGQRSLVEANRLIQTRGTPLRFVWLLFGDGSTLPDIRNTAESLGMTNMMFPGRTDAVRDALCASDIFVMPSDFEGMPNAMMEAMAIGLPCVSTNRSGALDVARDEREALYYDPQDAVRLSQHLLRLMQNPEEARTLGAAAAARIKEFSVGRFVKCFDDALDRALSAAIVPTEELPRALEALPLDTSEWRA